MQIYTFLIVAIVAEVIATSALKASRGFTNLLPSVTVIVGYGLAFYFLSLTLKTLPVGITYAIWSGAGIVLVSIIGWIAYGQKIDLWGFVGLGLIIAGLLIVNLLSNTSAH
ncbi:MAG: QacE family quaternary ammonium compound efflux SMR transporter [Geminicoccaceae bacterium]|nr:QacE family quaternary ammonium compound efflux SMR transporter [Geminicoccaceae bacterium]